jgi:hypothetical protein
MPGMSDWELVTGDGRAPRNRNEGEPDGSIVA